MFRKLGFALVAATALVTAALAPASASAGNGGHGDRGVHINRVMPDNNPGSGASCIGLRKVRGCGPLF
jgi:hypothetical protein